MQKRLVQGCGSILDQVTVIPLPEVVFDYRANDGTWCTLPYPGHPKGCKNFPQCIERNKPKLYTLSLLEWFAVIEEYDLKQHTVKMKLKHPSWSERQCRNLLYWQGGVRKRLRAKANKAQVALNGCIILPIPEACGVDVFKTMERVGIKLQRNPDYVVKVMLIGRQKKYS